MAGTYRSSKSGLSDKVAGTIKGTAQSKISKKQREASNKSRLESAKATAKGKTDRVIAQTALEKEKNKGRAIQLKKATAQAQYNKNRSRSKLSPAPAKKVTPKGKVKK